MSFLAGLGSAIGSMVGSAGGGLINSHIQNFFDRKMMNHQFHLNTDAWNMENAYNTPSMQMARFAEAGLNPNLIYGQQNTGGHINTASATAKEFNPLIGLQMSNLRADNANKHSQNALLDSQADYVKEQRAGVALENFLKRITIKSLTGKDPFDSANPNDPYWYRDAKKFMRLLYDKTFTGGTQAQATPPSVTDKVNSFWDFFNIEKTAERLERGKGRNRLYEIREGKKHYL